MQGIEQKIIDNEKLIYFVINKYFPQLRNDEDVEEIAMIGLWEAIEKYHHSKNTFSTYATNIIKNRILDYLRTNKQSNITNDEIEANQATDNSIDSDVLILVEYRLLITNFKPIERQIIRMLLDGKSNVEIANAININQSNVTRRIKTIKEKLTNVS